MHWYGLLFLPFCKIIHELKSPLAGLFAYVTTGRGEMLQVKLKKSGICSRSSARGRFYFGLNIKRALTHIARAATNRNMRWLKQTLPQYFYVMVLDTR